MMVTLKCDGGSFALPQSEIPGKGFITVMYDETRVARIFVDQKEFKPQELHAFAKTGKPVQVVLTW
ncbi:MAG: hypothetical protein AAB899_00065 [Patescibacteria group bacterium]